MNTKYISYEASAAPTRGPLIRSETNLETLPIDPALLDRANGAEVYAPCVTIATVGRVLLNQSGETLGANSPLCPQQRRESRHSRTAASGHFRTHAPQHATVIRTPCRRWRSNVGGIVMPGALAVLRFRNSSNFDGPLNYTCGMSSSKADAASAVVRRAPPDFEDWETVRTLILEAFAYVEGRINPPSSALQLTVESDEGGCRKRRAVARRACCRRPP